MARYLDLASLPDNVTRYSPYPLIRWLSGSYSGRSDTRAG
jgi:hypothetical protein